MYIHTQHSYLLVSPQHTENVLEVEILRSWMSSLPIVLEMSGSGEWGVGSGRVHMSIYGDVQCTVVNQQFDSKENAV
jgi:hypothetical protein